MAKLSPDRLVYTSAFGDRDPIKTPAGTTPSFHWGVDYGPEQRGKQGVPLQAVIAGPITRVRDQHGALGVFVGDKATRRIDLWHLASYTPAGEYADEGETLGVMGSTGLSTGVHVHVELWDHGRRVDPKPFLDAQASKAIAKAPDDYPRPQPIDEEDDPMKRYMFNDALRQITWPNGVTQQYVQSVYDSLRGYIGTYDWNAAKHHPDWAGARDTFVRESWTAVNLAK